MLKATGKGTCEIEPEAAGAFETGEPISAAGAESIGPPGEADASTPAGAAAAIAEEEGPEPARIPTSLTAALREQGPRFQHRVSRRMRRRGRDGRPEGRPEREHDEEPDHHGPDHDRHELAEPPHALQPVRHLAYWIPFPIRGAACSGMNGAVSRGKQSRYLEEIFARTWSDSSSSPELLTSGLV